jgi:hydroxypyruvate reductase
VPSVSAASAQIPGALRSASALGLAPARFLAENASTALFERLGNLLRSGPTCTNVNDFRAVLVDT